MDRDDQTSDTAAGHAPTDSAEDTSAGLVVPYLESLTLDLPAADRPVRLDISHPTGPQQSPPLEWVQFGLPKYQDGEPVSWPRSVLAELIPQAGALGDFLEHLPPGLRLARVLHEIDPQDVDDFSLVEVVAAHKRMEAWSAAKAARAAAVLAGRDSLNPSWPGDVPGRTRGECVIGQELSMRLRITKQAAVKMAACGRAFAGMFHPTGDMLERGLIDWARAQAIVTTLLDLPAEVALAAQWDVLDKAPGRTLRQVHDDLATAVIAVDPDSADDRHKAARQRRCVYHPRPLPDGMAMLSARLPAADAIAMDLALDASARAAKNTGDTRTLDQLRADSLALMAHTALTLGHIGPHAHRPCPCGCQGPTQNPDAPPGPAVQQDAVEAPVEVGTPPFDAEPPSIVGAPPPDAESSGVSGTHPAVEPPPPPGTAPPPSERPAPRPTAPPRRPRLADGPPLPGHRLPGGALPTIRVGMIGGGRADINVLIPINVLQPEPRDPSTTALDREPEPVAELDGYGPIPPIVARALATGGTWRRLLTDPVTERILDVGRTRYEPPANIADLVRHRDRTCILPSCTHPARTAQLDHIHEWKDGGTTSADNLGPQCTSDHRAKTIGAYTVAYATDRTYAWTTPTGHGYLRRPDATTITLPRHTAQHLRTLVKDTTRSGRPVDPLLIDAALAAASTGTDTPEHWALPRDHRSAPLPAPGHDHSWAGDEPPF
ncbi:HNH endonuclease signature motif containing protein [Georgenia satyanarayanai]|uniref:HNH endonuclease signature motif containing protein n=1 Tax=Georgenia satyanarayanai TaxID=860221 RepID=UPI00186AF8C3|nr:HNH endonuclease signature motif containing protein [Georgenia satyanarayanai]